MQWKAPYMINGLNHYLSVHEDKDVEDQVIVMIDKNGKTSQQWELVYADEWTEPTKPSKPEEPAQ
jgi:hypothetical protein